MKVVSNIYWILGALLTAIFFRSFVVSVHKIPTASMAPTFLAGDYILSSQMAYRIQLPWSHEIYAKSNPQAGDLVVLQFSATKAAAKSMAQYLKRVVAVPGDEIEIQQGKIILNGKPCIYEKSETKISDDSISVFTEICGEVRHDVTFGVQKDSKTLDSYAKLQVPPGEVYVLGDNRSMGDDSRMFGTIQFEQIASKVSFIWLSYGTTQDFISGSKRIRWNRILTKPR